MTLEAWGTVASFATFAVIAATAIAALVQLKHMRAANEIVTWQAFFDRYEGSEMRPAFDFVKTELAQRLEDPDFRAELRGVAPRRKHPEVVVCNFFDQWGLYYRAGTINRKRFMQANAGIVAAYWDWLAPVIALLADPAHGNLAFQQFEFLAVEAKRWQREHRGGDYPSGVPRLPLVDAYRELDRANEA